MGSNRPFHAGGLPLIRFVPLALELGGEVGVVVGVGEGGGGERMGSRAVACARRRWSREAMTSMDSSPYWPTDSNGFWVAVSVVVGVALVAERVRRRRRRRRGRASMRECVRHICVDSCTSSGVYALIPHGYLGNGNVRYWKRVFIVRGVWIWLNTQ